MNAKQTNAETWYCFQSTDLELRDIFLPLRPFLLGRHLAITAFDSGPLALMDEESQLGICEREAVVYYSPLTPELIGVLPYEGFDEWYLFPEPRYIGTPEVFVNFVPFRLENPEFSDRFWKQLTELRPLLYISDGFQLTIVTSDLELFRALLPNIEPGIADE